MTISEFFKQAAERFAEKGFEQPQLEARLTLQEALGLSSVEFISAANRELHGADVEKAAHWLNKRLAGMPLAYLSGKKGFFKNEFLIKPGVLVPRPETELVVEEALRRAPHAKRIADLGCGSGCIGLSLIAELPAAELWAVDVSEQAQEVTLNNARSLRLETRVHLHNGKAEEWQPAVKFDLIVTNPPYVPSGDPRVEKSVHDFEPHVALYSGNDGLDAIRAWSRWAIGHLYPGGVFVCEFGAGQNPAIIGILKEAGFEEIETAKDLAGLERVISAQRKR